jgi:hypothetical protein
MGDPLSSFSPALADEGEATALSQALGLGQVPSDVRDDEVDELGGKGRDRHGAAVECCRQVEGQFRRSGELCDAVCEECTHLRSSAGEQKRMVLQASHGGAKVRKVRRDYLAEVRSGTSSSRRGEQRMGGWATGKRGSTRK